MSAPSRQEQLAAIRAAVRHELDIAKNEAELHATKARMRGHDKEIARLEQLVQETKEREAREATALPKPEPGTDHIAPRVLATLSPEKQVELKRAQPDLYRRSIEAFSTTTRL